MTDATRSEKRYSPDHVWIDDGGHVGATAALVAAVPNVCAIHLTDSGTSIDVAQPFGALEGDKGLVDLYAPCAGRVVAINGAAVDDPSLVAEAPETVWLVRIEGSPGPLLTAEEYAARARRFGSLRRTKGG